MRRNSMKTHDVLKVALPSLVLLLASSTVAAQSAAATAKPAAAKAAPPKWPAALKSGQTSVNWLFRARSEYVDQTGVTETALANTLLSRVSVGQGITDQLRAGVEVDYVSVLGADLYNDTVHGQTRYPVVADPRGIDLNQALLEYQQGSHTFKVGRQKLALGNERFVGAVSWRQNEQTFDAVRYQGNLTSALKLDYSFSNRVHRVFGDDSAQGNWRTDLHLLDMAYSFSPQQQLKFFVYLMDFASAPAQSNQTVGVDYQQQGQLADYQLQLNASYAVQQDYADNPNSYQASYQNLDLQLQRGAWQVGAGYERLGSDQLASGQRFGFTTPLATLHKYQGFADKFLTTPANGVVDTQLKAGYVQAAWDLQLQYHWLDAASGDADYGTELDLTYQYKFSPRYAVLVKAAHYNADSHQTDTHKLWLQLLAKF